MPLENPKTLLESAMRKLVRQVMDEGKPTNILDAVTTTANVVVYNVGAKERPHRHSLGGRRP